MTQPLQGYMCFVFPFLCLRSQLFHSYHIQLDMSVCSTLVRNAQQDATPHTQATQSLKASTATVSTHPLHTYHFNLKNIHTAYFYHLCFLHTLHAYPYNNPPQTPICQRTILSSLWECPRSHLAHPDHIPLNLCFPSSPGSRKMHFSNRVIRNNTMAMTRTTMMDSMATLSPTPTAGALLQ